MMFARTFLFATVLALTACGGGDADVDMAVKAAAIAKDLKADPAHTETVLERHGLTEAQFEAQLYEIAADPEASKKYNAALAN